MAFYFFTPFFKWFIREMKGIDLMVRAPGFGLRASDFGLRASGFECISASSICSSALVPQPSCLSPRPLLKPKVLEG